MNEIFRVTSVLEKGLERNGSGWLVGDKCTYADLSFRTWASVGEGLLHEIGRLEGFAEKYPNYTAWLKKLDETEEVRKIKSLMEKGRADHGLK